MERNNSILCWLSSITLAWLPLVTSANRSMLVASLARHHEMSPDSCNKAPVMCEPLSYSHNHRFRVSFAPRNRNSIKKTVNPLFQ